MKCKPRLQIQLRFEPITWGRLQITEHFTHRQIDVVITGSVPGGVGGAGIAFAKLPWRLSGLHSAGRGISHADCMYAARRGGNRGSAAVKAGPRGVIKCKGPIITTVVVVVSRMTG